MKAARPAGPVVVGLGLVILSACAREAPPPVPVVPIAPAPQPAAGPSATPGADEGAQGATPAPAATASSCADALPEPSFLHQNVATTNMTGLAEIVASSKTATDGKSPPPTSGYVSFRYDVRVLTWFSGKGPERMVLRQGAEAEFQPSPAGSLLLFSACASGADAGFEPDTGYFFPVAPECRAEAEAAATAAAKGVPQGARKNASACKPPGP